MPAAWLPLLEIIWIDLLLSGDNAVVIALACRSLPKRQRMLGITLGSGVAIALRVVFTLLVVELLGLPFVKIVGGILLFWIAIQLASEDEPQKKPVREAASLWSAIRIIVVADAIMSLDNMMAIAAAAKGSKLLILFGLALSIPLIIFGSALRACAAEPVSAACLGGCGAARLDCRRSFDHRSHARQLAPPALAGL